MSRVLSVLLSIVLVGVLFAGCTKEVGKDSGKGNQENQENQEQNRPVENFNATGYPIVNDKINLKMMGNVAAIVGPFKDMITMKELDEMTNIGFEYNMLSGKDYVEKKNLAFASGEVPDVFFRAYLTPSEEVNYGKQGILLPLEDLIEKYAPNVKKMFEKYPEIKAEITTPDGHIYALPMVQHINRGQIQKIWINGEWAENIGSEPPSTTEELYQLLKDFKTKDPNQNGQADEIPMTSTGGTGWLRHILMAAFGHLGSRIEVKNDKVLYVPMEEGYKAYLNYMRRLYAEQLLDNQVFSHTHQEYIAKGKSGKVGIYPGPTPLFMLNIKMEEILDQPTLPPLTSPENKEKMYPKRSGTTRGMLAITNKNEHPEATMRWFDWFYDQESFELAIYGVEGETFEWVDGNPPYVSNEKFIPEGMTASEYRFGQVTSAFMGYMSTEQEQKFEPRNILVLGHNTMLNIKSELFEPFAKDPFPLVYYLDEEQKRLSILENDISTYVEEMEAKFIIGQEPMDKWDDYVKTLKKIGVEEMIGINQAAYNRWKEAQ